MEVATRIRQLLLDDPKLSVEDIQIALGLTRTARLYVDTIRREFLDTLKFLQAKGVIGGHSRHLRVGSGLKYRDR